MLKKQNKSRNAKKPTSGPKSEPNSVGELVNAGLHSRAGMLVKGNLFGGGFHGETVIRFPVIYSSIMVRSSGQRL